MEVALTLIIVREELSITKYFEKTVEKHIFFIQNQNQPTQTLFFIALWPSKSFIYELNWGIGGEVVLDKLPKMFNLIACYFALS